MESTEYSGGAEQTAVIRKSIIPENSKLALVFRRSDDFKLDS